MGATAAEGAGPTPGRPYALRADEGEQLWFLGNLVTLKATGAQTSGGLTVAHFVNPPGFAPPLHRHRDEDEMFYVLSGTVEYRCAEQAFPAGPGDFVLLPRGVPHTFLAGADGPLVCLQITSAAGFEDFAAAAGVPVLDRDAAPPEPLDPAALGHAAARYGIEVLGPPPLA